jgi:CubicO group peptidase (beta-lactamase class C family)
MKYFERSRLLPQCWKWLPVVLLMVLISDKSFGQTSDSIDAYINRVMKKDLTPGAAVAVIKDGKVIKESYYGYANIEDSIPVTSQTVFEIASMSKQFTCAAILLLQEDGKISVNDKASKYLDNLPDSWQNITVKQLMNHTSGLRDDWVEDNGYFMENYNDEKMFAAQKQVSLLFNPGENFNYSSGPFDLGLIIKKITGKTYAEFLEERIFKPLGMTSTSIYDEQRIVPHRAAGYYRNDSLSRLQRGWEVSSASIARGDVGVLTSLPDMIKWEAAMRTNSLLNAESRRQMFEAAMLTDGTPVSYGFGWFISLWSGCIFIEHGGGFRTGFHSYIMMLPEQKESVIFFSNEWNDHIAIEALLAILDPVNLKPASARTVARDTDPARTKSLNQFMRNFLDNKPGIDTVFYRKIFGPYFFMRSIDLGKLRNRLEGFTALTYINEKDFRANPITLYNVSVNKTIFYKVESKNPAYLSFNYDAAGKLAFIGWEE